MSIPALRQLSPAAVIMMVSLVAICAAYPAWGIFMQADMNPASLLNWSDVSWQIAEVDSRGRLVRLGAHPFALALLVGVITVACGSFAWAAWQVLAGRFRTKNRDDDLPERLEKVGQELDDEMFSVMRLLKQHLDLSGSHSEALSKVSDSLFSSTSPERIRSIIQFLISENKKVQNEVTELNTRLQHSQQQIEKLRISLSDSHRLGMLDAVTSLKNRHWIEVHLPKEVQAAAEANEPLSLIMADVDHFKRINDTFGHAVGDEILRRFAELLSKNIKGRDTAARFGGEEFVVVLPQTRVEGARNLGEQLRSELESKKWMHHKTGQPIGKVTASFGIVELRRGEDCDDLLDRVDAKLYEAKAQGRNRVVVDT
ncbi:diguanylate cyclase [Hyphomicrobium sp.]|uniref:GGDEF domain-containing protein n=1 Tax=Hyphomicrobium sp. TaxID=82 RepID=UPI000F94FD7E|nr:GGDEF domain-containing protein [Hyphomicrobium sp.]RUO98733.1 MAG: GGDEF domain-containing protein [Hyphomicrobium sp.]